jgi:hypothetical protein
LTLDAAALRRDMAAAETRLAEHVSGARRANLVLTLAFLALMAGLLTGIRWLLWPGLVLLPLAGLEILRRLSLITRTRDERLDLMMTLAALSATPEKEAP